MSEGGRVHYRLNIQPIDLGFALRRHRIGLLLSLSQSADWTDSLVRWGAGVTLGIPTLPRAFNEAAP